MTGFKRNESGLIVPEQKKEKPKYGPLELDEDESRENARKALANLWEAMELHESRSGICLPGSGQQYAARRQAWLFVATMLLGDDVPDCWEYT